MSNVSDVNDIVPNLERIEQLCQALESGGYAQGDGALRRGDKYCCIGVACDVMDPSGWRRIYEGDTHHQWKFDTEVGYMPERVVRWYGFNFNRSRATNDDWFGDPQVQVHEDGTIVSLTVLNDCYGYDFSKIARTIRRTYLPHTLDSAPS
jgi:hypothetical protein